MALISHICSTRRGGRFRVRPRALRGCARLARRKPPRAEPPAGRPAGRLPGRLPSESPHHRAGSPARPARPARPYDPRFHPPPKAIQGPASAVPARCNGRPHRLTTGRPFDHWPSVWPFDHFHFDHWSTVRPLVKRLTPSILTTGQPFDHSSIWPLWPTQGPASVPARRRLHRPERLRLVAPLRNGTL